MNDYDSKKDTIQHMYNVRECISILIKALDVRKINHDKSKLSEPEKSVYDEYTPKLSAVKYGSDEYKELLKQMQIGLDHHYFVNRHHPEHFANGINDMNLVDLCEMIADWKAASLRNNGNILNSINMNQSRFKYSDEVKNLLINTAKLFTKYSIYFVSDDVTDNIQKTGLYLGETIEEIRLSIDKDDELSLYDKNLLKFGYYDEFKNKNYHNWYQICPENKFHVRWNVNFNN